MVDKIFYGHNRKIYKVIKKHGSFENIWRCYPADLKAPYDQQLIKCFSEDYIKQNLL